MSSKQSLDALKQILKRIKGSNMFDRTLDKVKITHAENGKCRAEFTVAEEHQNIMGRMHGGFSATLVDCISTYALMTTERGLPGVSVDMHIRYLKAGNVGEEIVVEAETVKLGRTIAFLEVAIKEKKSNKLLVTGSHTKFLGK